MNKKEIALLRFALMYVVTNAEEAHKFISVEDGLGEITPQQLESEANFLRGLLQRATKESALP